MNKCTLVLTVLALSVLVGRAADQRPNILFIMSDDHTAQAVGAGPKDNTPNHVSPSKEQGKDRERLVAAAVPGHGGSAAGTTLHRQ